MSSRPSRSVIARVAFLFAAIGGLAACGPGPSPDIKAELARAREGQRGRGHVGKQQLPNDRGRLLTAMEDGIPHIVTTNVGRV